MFVSKEKSGSRDELHFNEFFHKIQAIFQKCWQSTICRHITLAFVLNFICFICCQLYLLHFFSLITCKESFVSPPSVKWERAIFTSGELIMWPGVSPLVMCKCECWKVFSLHFHNYSQQNKTHLMWAAKHCSHISAVFLSLRVSMTSYSCRLFVSFNSSHMRSICLILFKPVLFSSSLCSSLLRSIF